MKLQIRGVIWVFTEEVIYFYVLRQLDSEMFDIFNTKYLYTIYVAYRNGANKLALTDLV